jgi:hypothetical protein
VIASILFHMLIGLGGTCAGLCGKKFCRCTRHAILLTLALVAVEAVAMVLWLDPIMESWAGH